MYRGVEQGSKSPFSPQNLTISPFSQQNIAISPFSHGFFLLPSSLNLKSRFYTFSFKYSHQTTGSVMRNYFLQIQYEDLEKFRDELVTAA